MPSATTAWSSAMRILRAMGHILLALGWKRVNVPVVRTSTGLKCPEKWVFPSSKNGFCRVLSPLPRRALEPDLPAAALRRHLARACRDAARLLHPRFLVAPGGPRHGLRVRLGGALLFREEPPR